MQIQSKNINLIDIESIVPNPKNANRHSPEQITRLEKLIKYQGFRNPLIISNRTGFLIVGHGRLEAAKNLGYKKLPVIYQDFENEAQEYAYLISDNEIARWAELDKQAVYDELENIEIDDLELLGLEDFESPEIEEFEPQSDEDDVPEVEKPITKRGDVWLLGNHRLMCGDSTMIDDVDKLMNSEKADFVFTDPPYGMKLDADYSKMGSSGIKYDNLKGDHEDFNEDLINTIFTFSYVKEMFIFGADYFAELLANKNDGSWVVWDKRSNGDDIGVMDKQFGSQFELCWSKNKHKREIARILKETGVFAARGDDKSVHPTQKPIKLVKWFFDKWCTDLNLCVDLYLGSGTTLIACENTKKNCYGMELDEKYCDVIINRWQNYTGKRATLESSGQTYEELCDERK